MWLSFSWQEMLESYFNRTQADAGASGMDKRKWIKEIFLDLNEQRSVSIRFRRKQGRIETRLSAFYLGCLEYMRVGSRRIVDLARARICGYSRCFHCTLHGVWHLQWCHPNIVWTAARSLPKVLPKVLPRQPKTTYRATEGNAPPQSQSQITSSSHINSPRHSQAEGLHVPWMHIPFWLKKENIEKGKTKVRKEEWIHWSWDIHTCIQWVDETEVIDKNGSEQGWQEACIQVGSKAWRIFHIRWVRHLWDSKKFRWVMDW